MNKSFLILLVLVVFLGAGFGGSFVGGVIYGESRQQAANEAQAPRLGAVGQFPGGGPEGSGRGQVRRGQQGQQAGGQGAGGQGGPAASSPVAEAPAGQGPAEANSPSPVNRPQGPAAAAAASSPGSPPLESTASEARTPSAGTAPGRPGATGRGGLTGTIQGIAGDTLTIATPRGETQVAFAEETVIRQVAEAGREELAEGLTVLVGGPRQDDGSLSAQTIVIIPEDTAGLFSPGGIRGNRARGQ